MEADKVRYKLYSLGMARIEGGDNNRMRQRCLKRQRPDKFSHIVNRCSQQCNTQASGLHVVQPREQRHQPRQRSGLFSHFQWQGELRAFACLCAMWMYPQDSLWHKEGLVPQKIPPLHFPLRDNDDFSLQKLREDFTPTLTMPFPFWLCHWRAQAS